MIALQVNGKRVELEQPTPLLVYLDGLGVNPRHGGRRTGLA